MPSETITIVLNSKAEGQGIQATLTGLNSLKSGLEGIGAKLVVFGSVFNLALNKAAQAISQVNFVRHTREAIQFADALHKTAQRAGQAVESFSALSYAAALSDASQQDLITASRKLAEWMEKTGQSGKDMNQVFLEQADLIANLAREDEKLVLVQERFGRGGQALLPLLNQGSAAIRQQMEEARIFGVTVGPEFGRKAEQFNDNIRRMKQFGEGLFMALAKALLPSLTAMQEDFIKWARARSEELRNFIDDGVNLFLSAWREGRVQEIIALMVEAGVEEGLKAARAAVDTMGRWVFAGLAKAIDTLFSVDLFIAIAKAGKFILQTLLTAVKLPVDALSAGFEWVSFHTIDLFGKAFVAIADKADPIFLGIINTFIKGLNKVKIFGEFAPLTRDDMVGAQLEKQLRAGLAVRSFAEIFAEKQRESADAIAMVTGYLDLQIEKTRQLLTMGEIDEAQANNRVTALQKLLELLDRAAEARKKARKEGEPKPEPTGTSRVQIEGELKSNDMAFKKAELLERQLRTRGLIIEETGKTVGTLRQERKAIQEVHQTMLDLAKERRQLHGEMEASGLISGHEARQMELEDATVFQNIMERIIGLKEETEDFSFFERLNRNFDDLLEKGGSVSVQMADIMTNGIGRAIDTVADGIWQVIDGTATWGQLFAQVGRQIISDLIRMALQEMMYYVLKKTLLAGWKAIQSAFRTADVIESNATELAKAPALTATAVLKSIGSFGLAVVIGLAAMAGVMALLGGFREGGVVHGDEQLIRVNEDGEEAVLNARATAALGPGIIDALNRGAISMATAMMMARNSMSDAIMPLPTALDGAARSLLPSPGFGRQLAYGLEDLESRIASNVGPPSEAAMFPPTGAIGMSAGIGGALADAGLGGGGGQPTQLNIVLVDSRNAQAARDFIASSEGKVLVADVVRENKLDIGIK